MLGFFRFLARQRKMPGFPTHIVRAPGKSNPDTEDAPHNSGVPLTSFRIKSPFEAQGRPALQGQSRRRDRSISGEGGLSGHGARREERFLSARADAFAGANAEEKSRPAPFEMTGGGRGQRGKSARSVRSGRFIRDAQNANDGVVASAEDGMRKLRDSG